MLAGEPHEIIGVLPTDFRPVIVTAAQVWRPDRLNLANPSRGAVVLRVVARMAPGVRGAQLDAGARTRGQRLETRFPESNTGTSINVVPLQEHVVGNARAGLLVLFAAVVLVLLIACVNIANLLLARSSSRSREIAVRTALGAGRGRVMRQLLTESLVLAGMGGVMGTSSAFGVSRPRGDGARRHAAFERGRPRFVVLAFAAS